MTFPTLHISSAQCYVSLTHLHSDRRLDMIQVVVFRDLFTNTGGEVLDGRVVIRTDFPRETIQSFLEFTYSGKFIGHFPETTVDRKRLIKAAAKYHHKPLADLSVT